MEKKISFGKEAREKLLSGVDQLADAVVATLGPSGRNVFIEKQGEPISTKDGVTVAEEVHLSDPIENVGAQAVKQVSIKTAKNAGDGTTTATLLAREIYKQGLSELESSNAVEVKRGIDIATKAVVKYTFNIVYVFFHWSCKYVVIAILDNSKNEPIMITGIATLANRIDNPITL